MACLISGVPAYELDEDAEAAGVLLAETFSMARQYMSEGKRK